jgi:biopolymer transport protein ExbB
VQAQDEATPAGTEVVDEAGEDPGREGMGFVDVLKQSGVMGILLWVALLAISVAGVWLAIDSFVTIQERKIVPATLVERVREAMEQGDVMKAIDHCAEEPGPLSSILSAGFTNVEEGFEVVQDAIAVAADLESEKLMQRVSYLNLVGNLAPMLGLLGTVQGMIYAFQNLGIGAGGSGSSLLALNISQALFTTAAGLSIAVPAVGFYYFFRNRATNIILGMEGLTLDLVKVLRNVEIVDD